MGDYGLGAISSLFQGVSAGRERRRLSRTRRRVLEAETARAYSRIKSQEEAFKENVERGGAISQQSLASRGVGQSSFARSEEERLRRLRQRGLEEFERRRASLAANRELFLAQERYERRMAYVSGVGGATDTYSTYLQNQQGAGGGGGGGGYSTGNYGGSYYGYDTSGYA